MANGDMNQVPTIRGTGFVSSSGSTGGIDLVPPPPPAHPVQRRQHETAEPKIPFSEMVRRHMVQVTGAFFSADGIGSDDPLVDIAHRDPVAASRFIKVVMLFSGIVSMIVCLVCAVFLRLHWSACGGCDRPLRWWLLVHAILQISQLPVRIVFLTNVWAAENQNESIEAHVASFTASPAWRMSKTVSLLTYGWFVLGIVWVLNAGNCTQCPGIYRLTIVVILQAVIRTLGTLLCFRILFPDAPVAPDATPKMEGASAEQIAALPSVNFCSSMFSEKEMSCAVCLAEYVDGDEMRHLPCGHYFHRRCADQWLKRSKRCPLCIRAIDGPKEVKKAQ
eukprot:gnl/TRDRNA2_/TRDRNA2_189460_c0_seq1.p1 gnl/TRDRNA2_/TRDRNA2_189460_c0~~gnl/TRDRNA2_/TRDRNA2_189460_c0_seq1.p1  ORF type:complete len:334 (+),score=55.63 gnl/TRDRNA2_/TRDRNA2_189460_c0_seq1:102-1103(+)